MKEQLDRPFEPGPLEAVKKLPSPETVIKGFDTGRRELGKGCFILACQDDSENLGDAVGDLVLNLENVLEVSA